MLGIILKFKLLAAEFKALRSRAPALRSGVVGAILPTSFF